MICVRLEGGLGNQLFQYAAGRTLSVIHDTELLLDASGLGKCCGNATLRNFELGCFGFAARFASPTECKSAKYLINFPFLSRYIGLWRIHTERLRNFDPCFFNLPDQTYLRGYWQNPLYFERIASLLANEIEPTVPLSQFSQEVANKIFEADDDSVSIHVRRGDYLSLPSAAKYHGVLSVAYYKESLDLASCTVNRPKLFIFSDDIDWCCKSLPLHSYETHFVAHNTGSDAWQDLILMSYCRHNIIANSSFSWWGAWLADHRYGKANRLVVAPRKWFTSKEVDPVNRFPKHWKIL